MTETVTTNTPRGPNDPRHDPDWRSKTRDPILVERQKTHGDFTVHANITQQLKSVMRQQNSFGNLSDRHREALDMIVHKIGRILAGNPNFHDHWDDIAGYAKLGAEACGSR